MKFRKSSVSSPKMELLSRRSSNDTRMSTLKRSRSFRASMKLMSKLKSHANLRLNRNAGFDLSPVALRDERSNKGRNKLSFVEESSSSPVGGNTECITEERILDDLERDSVSLNELESRRISKELKNKLCLTDRIMRRNRKDTEKNSKKNSGPLSPKMGHIFRWKNNEENATISCTEKKDAPRPDGGHVSYENPTFCLDSSLDSSVSSFLFDPTNSSHIDIECKDEVSLVNSCQDTVLTLLVDSRRCCEKEAEKREIIETVFEGVENFECNKNNRPLFNSPKARSLSVNDVIVQDDEEIGRSLDLNDYERNFCCQSHRDDDLGSKGRKSSEKIRKTSVCSSKSCRIRTVDNITNFWTNARGSSFRNKVSVGRKKSMKDSRDESIGQDRQLVTTASGSSTAYQLFN